MIDRTLYLPAGALPVMNEKTGVGGILCYIYEADKAKVWFPAALKDFDLTKERRPMVFVWDYFKQKPTKVVLNVKNGTDMRADLYERQVENYNRNKGSIKSVSEFPERDTVVICGAGPTLKHDLEFMAKHRDKICIITLNSAQALIEGDYFVTCESLDLTKMMSEGRPKLNGTTPVQNTHAHVSTITHPNILKLGWKNVTFYTHLFDFEEQRHDIPNYFVGRHGTFDAIQFAAKDLKAKKIIFTGVDYQYGEKVQRQNVSLIEAAAFIAGKNNIDVWNVSMKGAFSNGVKLGTFQQAMEN